MSTFRRGYALADDSVPLQSKRISDVALTFLDVETTGLSPRDGDRVCEIALIRQEPSAPERVFTTLIDPERPISPGAFRVNRITENMLTGAPRFAGVLETISFLLKDAVLVAHNAPFDLGFLQAEFARCGQSLSIGPVVDTLQLARGQSRFGSCSLASVARTLGLKNEHAHRALGDCRVTQQVLSVMIRDAFPPPTVPLVSDLISLSFTARLTPAGTDELPPDLAEMIESESPFSIVYQKAEGQISTYNVQVTDVGRLGPNIYLVAHAFSRGGTRHFRLDRILSWRPYKHMDSPPGADNSADAANNAESPVIRRMAVEELHSLHDLWTSAGLEFRPKVRDSIENLIAQWDADPEGFIGAFAGERLIGSVLATDDGRRGWINRVAVHPDFRHSGLGAALVRAAETELRQRGLRIIAALIDEDNVASQSLFKKLEYEEMPEVKYFSKRDSWDV